MYFSAKLISPIVASSFLPSSTVLGQCGIDARATTSYTARMLFLLGGLLVALNSRAPALLGVFLVFASPPALAQEHIDLRASDVHDASYPTVRGLQSMAEQLDLATHGRIRLRIYPGAQLGDERDMLEMTIFGGIDVSRTSMAPLNSIAPETGVFSLPFLFRSTEHMRLVLDGPIGDEILAGLEPHGLIGLAYYDAGARNLYNRVRPMHSGAEVGGL